MSDNNPFQKLQLPDLPFKVVGWEIPRPVLHPIEPNCIILSTETMETNGGIYKYNLENNETICLAKYNEIKAIRNDYLKSHTQFIDSKNNKLYICGGEGAAFMTYEINTGIIKVGENNDDYNYDLANCYSSAKVVHIVSSTRNEIHILEWDKHWKFDCIQQKFTMKNVSSQCDPEDLRLSYNPLRKQLMILGEDDYSDEIWTSDIKTCEWKLNTELKMPHDVGELDEIYYEVLLGGDIIFVFYLHAIAANDDTKYDDIWWLDLLNEKWYKSTYNIPFGNRGDGYLMKSKNSDDIHFLSTYYDKSHFKVNIHKLLSMEFINDRRDYYNPLIIGYIKEQEKNKLIRNVPFVLKQLILNYFPVIDYHEK